MQTKLALLGSCLVGCVASPLGTPGTMILQSESQPQVAQAPTQAPTTLPIDSLVEGHLNAGDQQWVPFQIDTPKHGSYYGDGLYTIEAIMRSPAERCGAAAQIGLKVLDEDGVMVDQYAVGDSFGTGNGEHTWKKTSGHFDFAPGSYRLQLEATTACGVDYRIRLVRKQG